MSSLITILLGCFAVGGFLMLIACRHVGSAERRERWTKFFVYFAIVMTMMGAAYLGKTWLQALMLLIVALGGVEVWGALKRIQSTGTPMSARIWTAYGLICAASWLSLGSLQPIFVAYVYVVVAGFDGFSQVSGQLLGRHKLAPRLSPGKTVEGVLGGVLGAVALALLAGPLVGLPLFAAVQVSLLICLAGLVGDLGASWLKRRAGIKDYSRVLPGHGGILDRFDSFLPALAISGPWFLLDGVFRA